MLLSGNAVLRLIRKGTWTAKNGDQPLSDDFLARQVGPNSINVTLHGSVGVYTLAKSGWVTPTGGELPEVKTQSLDQTWIASCAGQGRTTLHQANPEVHDAAHLPGVVLEPGAFLLSRVQEEFNCSQPVGRYPRRYYAQMLTALPTLTALGLGCRLASGPADYGFREPFLLEFHNLGAHSILLRPGKNIAQVSFLRIDR